MAILDQIVNDCAMVWLWDVSQRFIGWILSRWDAVLRAGGMKERKLVGRSWSLKTLKAVPSPWSPPHLSFNKVRSLFHLTVQLSCSPASYGPRISGSPHTGLELVKPWATEMLPTRVALSVSMVTLAPVMQRYLLQFYLRWIFSFTQWYQHIVCSMTQADLYMDFLCLTNFHCFLHMLGFGHILFIIASCNVTHWPCDPPP